jgi:arsenate reductase-like glutaredoxin family protein
VRAELSQAGVDEIEERDFFKDPFSKYEIEDLLGSNNPSLFFSYRSPSFRKLELTKDFLSREELISLMSDEPRLIRRPLIAIGTKLIVGTDKDLLDRII